MGNTYRPRVNSAASTQMIRRGLCSSDLSRKQLEFLAHLPSYLNTTLDNQRIVNIALQHLQTELNAQSVILFLLDEQGVDLMYWGTYGVKQERKSGTVRIDRQSAVGRCFGVRFPYFVLDAKVDLQCSHPLCVSETEAQEVISLICIPLVTKTNECIGVVQVVNQIDGEHFTIDDVAFIDQFCHQVVLAIDNARLYRDAKRKSQHLRMLDKRKSEMIKNIAHEFLTPVSIIQTSAELLLTDDLGARKSEIGDLLQRGLSRLTKLISEVRTLSVVQAEDLKITNQLFDVGQLLDEICESFKSVASNRKLKLLVRKHGRDLKATGDKALLSIALQNLVSNAIRFTPDGGDVLLCAEDQSDFVVIAIIDTGIGIAVNDQTLIFEKFYEVQASGNHSSGDCEFKSCGLGIGLAAVKHILSAHNSTAQVKSELGKGSTFSFILKKH